LGKVTPKRKDFAFSLRKERLLESRAGCTAARNCIKSGLLGETTKFPDFGVGGFPVMAVSLIRSVRSTHELLKQPEVGLVVALEVAPKILTDLTRAVVVMPISKKFLTAAAFGATMLASPAFAAPPPPVVIPSCAIIGLDDIVPTAQACDGYYQGNLLNAANLTQQTTALGNIGLAWGGVTLEKLDPGAALLNFNTVLNGLTWIGIHYGAGQGPVDAPGGVTAFYRFDAGVNRDTFNITPGSISGVSLYATSPGTVPEPAAWALMMMGFGIAGTAMRRRAKVAFA
jgi:hypothetical protein